MTGINMTECMRVFRKVVEAGSFTRAAKELRISVAWTAKNVGRLEEALGATLLIRSTRQLRITEAGQICYETAGRVLDEVHVLKEHLGNESPIPVGKLRISMPHILAVYGMGEIIGEFSKRYPEVDFDIMVDDRFVDLLGEGFDFVFRIATNLKDSQLLKRSLCTVQRILCASPKYLTIHGQPTNLDALSAHRCLVYSWLAEPDIWTFRQNGREIKIHPNVHMSVNNSSFIKSALLSGCGVGYLPKFIVCSEINQGSLVPLLPEAECEAFTLYLLRAADRFQTTRARFFSEFIANALNSSQFFGEKSDNFLTSGIN